MKNIRRTENPTPLTLSPMKTNSKCLGENIYFLKEILNEKNPEPKNPRHKRKMTREQEGRGAGKEGKRRL